MTDLLEKASNWLQERRTQYASRVVTYARGAASVDLPATVGKTTFEVDDGFGVLVRSESRDFLVLATDLVLGGQPALPQRGDRIAETQDGTTYVYEVIAPGNAPCWRYSDSYRQALRIHTKQVEGTS
jgi:hypothetical protein